jgi:hypothetical protein
LEITTIVLLYFRDSQLRLVLLTIATQNLPRDLLGFGYKIKAELNNFPKFARPAKIDLRNFFFAISGVVIGIFLTISCLCDHTIAEKVNITFQAAKKKFRKVNFCRGLEIGKSVQL